MNKGQWGFELNVWKMFPGFRCLARRLPNKRVYILGGMGGQNASAKSVLASLSRAGDISRRFLQFIEIVSFTFCLLWLVSSTARNARNTTVGVPAKEGLKSPPYLAWETDWRYPL